MNRGIAPGLRRPFRCPMQRKDDGATRAVNRNAVSAPRSSNSSSSIAPTTAGMASNENVTSNESNSYETDSSSNSVMSVSSTVNATETSPIVSRNASPRKREATDDSDSRVAPSKRQSVEKSCSATEAASTPAEEMTPPPSPAPSVSQPVDDRKMPSAETAPAVSAAALTVQLETLSKASFFVDLQCQLEGDEWVECIRALCNNDATKLAQLIVANARFHRDRCNKQMNLTEFFSSYCNALSDAFPSLADVQKLINAHNNHASRAIIPTHPTLPLPPGVMPVNVHALGAVGQHCGRGAGQCLALRNGVAPTFTLISVSSGGGSNNTNEQYCSTCNECFAETGFDPARTFADKQAFDSYMATYATRHNFKLTKDTGSKVSVGAAKVPKYVLVQCSKKSAHRRGSDCSCPFKVSAVLRVKSDGSYEYKLNKIVLTHE